MKFYRKGMLVPEGMGLVIAIIGLVILGFFGVKLYNVFVEQDMKNAKTFIEGLNAKIENLDDGESNTFALRGVQDWVLVGWNASDKTRPEKCFLNSCLCLCKDSVANCQENGYCRAVDRNVSVKSDGSVNYLKTVVGMGTARVAGSFSASCITFKENLLIPLFISKNKNTISIKLDYGLLKDEGDGELIEIPSKLCPGYSDNIAVNIIAQPKLP